MAPKRAVKHDAQLADEPDSGKAKPRTKKAKQELKEPFTDSSGWTTHPPSLIYKDYGTKPCHLIAAFDLDGTLVNTKSNMQFPRSADDWRWYNKKVVKVLQHYVQDGFKVVVFSNQGGIKSALTGAMATKVKERVEQVASKLEVPIQVFLATLDDDNRKPNTGMWRFMSERCNGGVSPDLKKSFFVGDAAGRAADFADSDKTFAENVGLKFKTPEDVFGEMEGKRGAAPAAAAAAGAPELNPELVDVFARLAAHHAGDRFKSAAYGKVAGVLRSFPQKVTASNLKEVGKLPGVGKASLALIQEFVTTGKCQFLEDAEGGGATGELASPAKGAAAKSPAAAAARPKANDMAMKFM